MHVDTNNRHVDLNSIVLTIDQSIRLFEGRLQSILCIMTQIMNVMLTRIYNYTHTHTHAHIVSIRIAQ